MLEIKNDKILIDKQIIIILRVENQHFTWVATSYTLIDNQMTSLILHGYDYTKEIRFLTHTSNVLQSIWTYLFYKSCNLDCCYYGITIYTREGLEFLT